MDNTVELRPLIDRDIDILKSWLVKPHVKKWYHDENAWLNEIEHRKDKYSFIKHFIVFVDDKPIGFCQYYDYEKGGENWHGNFYINGAFSIDYLIGEEEYLGKHLSPVIVELLEEAIIKKTEAKKIIVQPDMDNIVSRNTLLSSGYYYDEDNDVFYKELDR